MASRWGMAVDLDTCTGCGACVTACHAENNIPTVGPEQAAVGRAMHWIRIESYWDGEFPEARMKFRPVMCQHCDAAPCEPVCPTYASHHTEEGLNAQVYNRCIGTRYCANACPYNVRFFEFYNPEWPKPLQVQLNPDVSVREVGVMEKCTFCVQRITAATDRREGREEATQGRRNQAGVRPVVHGQGAGVRRSQRSGKRSVAAVRSPRGSKLLEDLGTLPKVTYLAKQSLHDRGDDVARRPPIITEDLLRPLASPSWRFYLLVLFLGSIVAVGASAFIWQVYYGLGKSGIGCRCYWGFYITNFVFWIGISHAGTLISAILRLVNAGWRRPVTRCAEVITAFALMIGAMFPIIHLGRPWLFFWLDAVSEQRDDVAEFPIAAGLGFFCDLGLPHRQFVVSVPADDSGFRASFATAPPGCGRRSTDCWRLAGAARPCSGTDSRPACRSWRSRSFPLPCRSTPSSRSIFRWRRCRSGTRRSSARTLSPARFSAASPA